MAAQLRHDWADDVEVFAAVRAVRSAAEAGDVDLAVMAKLDLVKAALGAAGYAELLDELRDADGRVRVSEVVAWFDREAGTQAKN